MISGGDAQGVGENWDAIGHTGSAAPDAVYVLRRE